MAAAAALATPALYPAFFFVLEKAVKSAGNAVISTLPMHRSYGLQGSLKRRYKHPSLLPSMGTTRQKSSCRNGLQNGPRLLSRVKAGTHSPSPTGSHTAAYTPKQGPSGQGRYHYPRRIPHVHEHPRAGCQNGKLCRFWVLAGGALPKNAESLRSSDALMRVAAPRRRGPAGLRNLFRFCRNRDLYIRRSWFSACARRGVVSLLSARFTCC